MKDFEYLVTDTYYNLKSGVQEYRLYSYLSTLFDNVILDLGTSHGTSAIALSHNMKNKVISYDIVDCINNKNHLIYRKNIDFKIKNILDDLTSEFIKHVKIVMIDIDHYGSVEKQIIDKLYDLGFSGIILIDDAFNHPDTKINNCMKMLWNNLQYHNTTKHDITKYGHWSGTGMILMNADIKLIFD